MASVAEVRSVRVHQFGESQTIDIPKEFALLGDVATMTRDTQGRLIVESTKVGGRLSLSEIVSQWAVVGKEDSMPLVEDLPAEPVSL
jgi:virulence-associated protein VagC